MKIAILPFLLFFITIASTDCLSQSKKNGSLLIGIFDGRTPCREIAKQLNEKPIPACTKIKWRVILHKDPSIKNSGSYELEGFVFRGNNILKGRWQTITGTKSDPDAIVYQLDHPVRGPVYLQKGDDNVLFFLDKEKSLMVGNMNFSYALYRTKEN